MFHAKDLQPRNIISETKESDSDFGDGDDHSRDYINNSEEHTAISSVIIVRNTTNKKETQLIL